MCKDMKYKRIKGVALVEALIAAVILSIAVLGGITYRYYSVLDGRRAVLQSTAARAAQLLCESWHGEGGDTNYNPVSHLTSDNFTITAGSGPDVPAGFTLLGKYQIQYNGVKCYSTLSWKNVQTQMRALSVVVSWATRDKAQNSLSDMDRQFALTNYVTW
jgi:Tfp pilus assembly protein PilV